MTVTGRRWAETSTGGRRPSAAKRFRQCLREQDGVDPDDVILPPEKAKAKG